MVKDVDKWLGLMKKYGVGLVLLVFFLYQHYSLVKERDDIIRLYQQTLKDNISMLVRIDEKFKSVDDMSKEIKEIRYEQRRLNDILNLPSKRYNNE